MPSTRRRAFTVANVDVAELESRVVAWEEKYGVASDAMAGAFTRDGVLVEDDDYLEWSHDWAALQAARQSEG